MFLRLLVLACLTLFLLAMSPSNQKEGKGAPGKRKSSRLQAHAEERQKDTRTLYRTRSKLNLTKQSLDGIAERLVTTSGKVSTRTKPTEARSSSRGHAESDARNESHRHNSMLILAEACKAFEPLPVGMEEETKQAEDGAETNTKPAEAGAKAEIIPNKGDAEAETNQVDGAETETNPTKGDAEAETNPVDGAETETNPTKGDAEAETNPVDGAETETNPAKGDAEAETNHPVDGAETKTNSAEGGTQGETKGAGQNNPTRPKDVEKSKKQSDQNKSNLKSIMIALEASQHMPKDGSAKQKNTKANSEWVKEKMKDQLTINYPPTVSTSPKSESNSQKLNLEKEKGKASEEVNDYGSLMVAEQSKHTKSSETLSKEKEQNSLKIGRQNNDNDNDNDHYHDNDQSIPMAFVPNWRPNQRNEQMQERPTNTEAVTGGKNKSPIQQQHRVIVLDDDEEMTDQSPTKSDQRHKTVIDLDDDEVEEMMDQHPPKNNQNQKRIVIDLDDDEAEEMAERKEEKERSAGNESGDMAMVPFNFGDAFLDLSDEEFVSQFQQKELEMQPPKSKKKKEGTTSFNQQNNKQLKMVENNGKPISINDSEAIKSGQSDRMERNTNSKNEQNDNAIIEPQDLSLNLKYGKNYKQKMKKQQNANVIIHTLTNSNGGDKSNAPMPEVGNAIWMSKSKPAEKRMKESSSNEQLNANSTKNDSVGMPNLNNAQNANVLQNTSTASTSSSPPLGLYSADGKLLEEIVGTVCSESIRAIDLSALEYGFISNEIFTVTFQANVGKLVKAITERKRKFTAAKIFNLLRGKINFCLFKQILDEILAESAEFGAKMGEDLAQKKDQNTNKAQEEMQFLFFYARLYRKLSNTLKWGSIGDPTKTTKDQTNKNIREYFEWFEKLNGGLSEKTTVTIRQNNCSETAKWFKVLCQMEETVELANFGILLILPHETWHFFGAERPTTVMDLFEKIGRAKIFEQIDDSFCDINSIEEMVNKKLQMMDHLSNNAMWGEMKGIANGMVAQVKQCLTTTMNFQNIPSKIVLFLGILNQIHEKLDNAAFLRISLSKYSVEKNNGMEFLAKCLNVLTDEFESFQRSVLKEVGDLAKMRKGQLEECRAGRSNDSNKGKGADDRAKLEEHRSIGH